jgi:hypothetical protein
MHDRRRKYDLGGSRHLDDNEDLVIPAMLELENAGALRLIMQ